MHVRSKILFFTFVVLRLLRSSARAWSGKCARVSDGDNGGSNGADFRDVKATEGCVHPPDGVPYGR